MDVKKRQGISEKREHTFFICMLSRIRYHHSFFCLCNKKEKGKEPAGTPLFGPLSSIMEGGEEPAGVLPLAFYYRTRTALACMLRRNVYGAIQEAAGRSTSLGF